MRISTGLIFRQALNSLQTQQSELIDIQNQLSSGTKLLTPADDPAGAKRVLDLRQTLGLNAQYADNADTALTRLTLEETTLEATTNVLQRVRELTLQANSATLGDSDRRALAAEVEQRLGELLGIANTKDGNNEYLYSGFSSGTKPFARQGGGFVYNGDDGQRFLSLGPGFDMAVSDSGTAVFRDIPNGNGLFRTLDSATNTGDGVIDAGNVVDASAFIPDTYTISFPTADSFEVRDSGAALVTSGAFSSGQTLAFLGAEVTIAGRPAPGDTFQVVPSTAQDAFTTLDNVLTAMRQSTTTGADEARVHNALNRALVDLDQAMENVSTIRSSVGARLNATENERFIAEDFSLQLKASISAIEDVDIADAVSRLTQQRTSLEAAQRSFVSIQNLTLFNFL